MIADHSRCVSAQSKSLTGGADTDTYGQYLDSGEHSGVRGDIAAPR